MSGQYTKAETLREEAFRRKAAGEANRIGITNRPFTNIRICYRVRLPNRFLTFLGGRYYPYSHS